MQQTAIDNRESFDPGVIQVIEESFYVDDCLASFEDETTAANMAQSLTELCAKCGFKLHKFESSSDKVLESLTEDQRVRSVSVDGESTYLLGMKWNHEGDCFKFSVKDDLSVIKPTRRTVLSYLAKIYDPLGIISPLLLNMKSILQRCCVNKIEWDDEIESPLSEEIHEWASKLEEVKHLSIRRCIKPPNFGEMKSTQLHTFCDASEKGYSAVVYVRLTNDKGEIHCTFLMGKCRVTPTKRQTLPRLELAAAALGAKLYDMVSSELKMNVNESYFWCDNKTVLAYILNESNGFKLMLPIE